MCDMIKLTIGENQGNQRLDRFLKKYFAKASLSHIYKLIRKDVKVNGKRKNAETMLNVGDEITVYISEEDAAALQKEVKKISAKKQFTVVYEDRNIIVVAKPFGLLTHGDRHEKKNHLANQVVDYLIANGEYDPRADRTFVPSPANRLDRNTTGLVIFGKNSTALQELNKIIRERDAVDKIYMTIATGKLTKSLHLKDYMVKDEARNTVSITEDTEQGKMMDTEVFPVMHSNKGKGYTLVEVKINTGRTHQIRVQLAEAGHPVLGDTKYGTATQNRIAKERYGLSTHLLHAYKLAFSGCDKDSPLAYLNGKEFICPLPENFESIKNKIFGEN